MQKEINVKKILCLSLIVLLVNFSFSQNKLEGKYKVEYQLNDFSGKYVFTGEGVFSSENYGDIGLISFGKGHYFIKKDSLILDYDLTNLEEESYFKSKKYYNYKDSITINLNIYDFQNKPIRNVVVYAYPNSKSKESDEKGNAILKFKKQQVKNKIELHLDGEFLAKQIIYIDPKANYIINAYMNKNKIIDLGHPKAIKNEIVKFKIIEITEQHLKLKNGKQKVTLKKE